MLKLRSTAQHLLGMGVGCVLAACSSDATGPSAVVPSVTIEIAALSYPGVEDVCYSFAVTSAAAEVVIARGPLSTLADPARNPAFAGWANGASLQDTSPVCATQFGNGAGGDWSYVAPCDASVPGDHTATLWLDTLTVDGGVTAAPGVDYQDPCPAGCTLQAACQENADTPVTFNITVMRRAQQGFFDIGVNFDDIFCSAKVDCLTNGGDPLTLLHHPETGLRGQTAVLGLACTAGPGAEGTVLLRDPITLTCGADAFTFDPAQPEGNVYTASTGANPAPAGSPVWQYAVYAGQEALECSGEPCQKVYWNIALGFDPLADGCTLTTAATAGTATSLTDLTTPEASTWPIIEVDVDLTLPGGGLACSAHPLNGSPTGVATTYTQTGPGRAFAGGFDGNAYLSSVATGTSCRTILSANPGSADGVYILDPDGPGGQDPFEAYCDMTTDGGGWTLVANQVPTQPITEITNADVWQENEGHLDASFRVGNTRLAALQPTLAWRMSSHLGDGSVVDRGFASPACVVDWLRMIGPANGCGTVPSGITTTNTYDLICGRLYTTTDLTTAMSGYNAGSNCTLGIGQNNSGTFCSMRMANGSGGAPYEGVALPCQLTGLSTQGVRLWSR